MLQDLPEGVMIYKKFDNPHIKLWNNEFIKLFKFKSMLPNKFSSTSNMSGNEKTNSTGDADCGGFKENTNN